MHTEFEATYTNINKDTVRQTLKSAGATLVKPEFLQKRVAFSPPFSSGLTRAWARVRDEGNKITVSLKWVDGDSIENQHEVGLTVDSFDSAKELLTRLGCKPKAYQETKRELWQLNGVDITIDEWPFLEPFVEVEGPDEQSVRAVSQQLGFDYTQAFFGAVDTLYSRKYNISEDRINNHTPEIVFTGPNPFIK